MKTANRKSSLAKRAANFLELYQPENLKEVEDAFKWFKNDEGKALLNKSNFTLKDFKYLIPEN